MSNDKNQADVQPGGAVRLGQQAERARFEAWASAKGLNAHIYSANGMYSHPVTRGAWLAWQHLSAQPSPGGQCTVGAEAIEAARSAYKAVRVWSTGTDREGNQIRSIADLNRNDDAAWAAALTAALAAHQPVGPKFYTEDGPCWWHAGKAFIVTVDGDNLQLSVMDGPRCEFIGDARPFRVPANPVGEPVFRDHPTHNVYRGSCGNLPCHCWADGDHIIGDEVKRYAAPPARAVDLGEVIEQIAEQWDGCSYDVVGETIDIGLAIRSAGKQIGSQA